MIVAHLAHMLLVGKLQSDARAVRSGSEHFHDRFYVAVASRKKEGLVSAFARIRQRRRPALPQELDCEAGWQELRGGGALTSLEANDARSHNMAKGATP